MSNPFEEHLKLTALIELQLEDRISVEQFEQLEALIRSDTAARRFYRHYIDLHGMLHWDTALTGTAVDDPVGSVSPSSVVSQSPVSSVDCDCAVETSHSSRGRRSTSRQRRVRVAILSSVAALLLLGSLALLRPEPAGGPTVADSSSGNPAPMNSHETPGRTGTDGARPDPLNHATDSVEVASSGNPPDRSMAPVQLPEHGTRPAAVVSVATPDRSTPADHALPPDKAGPPAESGSAASLVAFIDREIEQGWADSDVVPSPVAEDSEWLRRVYLDIVGHIPPGDAVVAFLDDRRPDKRERVVAALLDDEDYTHNFTTIWTKLLIGRSNPRNVDRAALQRFLREAFGRNRGWDGVVADLISAEGTPEENGATTFLLAHVNNQAVPATALTGRLFLGLQLQCMQCHDHPFNDRKQDDFWAFNSFFQQVDVVARPRPGMASQRDMALVDQADASETLYETRSGLLKATLPRYEQTRVPAEPGVQLRRRLADLLREGETPQIARAFVNRMWQHFLGTGFTPVVDDMGPHVPVSHPAVLDRLSAEFVRSGYDVRQLVRWISATRAYGLSSRMSDRNQIDDPAIGNPALFSRVYLKSMTVEQAFDSLLIATRAREVFGSDWETVEGKRQAWLQQFVQAFETDENDEANLFDGSIAQALMLMNGDLVKLGLESGRGTFLDQVARGAGSENEKIEQIALAALSRRPTAQEVTAIRRMIRENAQSQPRPEATRSGLEDLFWACLNSNEFILVH